MIIVMAAATVLAIGAIFFIAKPLLRPPPKEFSTIGMVSFELLARRDRIYSELLELEFDFRVGKVTDPEYSESRDRLESDAARALRPIHPEPPPLHPPIAPSAPHPPPPTP